MAFRDMVHVQRRTSTIFAQTIDYIKGLGVFKSRSDFLRVIMHEYFKSDTRGSVDMENLSAIRSIAMKSMSFGKNEKIGADIVASSEKYYTWLKTSGADDMPWALDYYVKTWHQDEYINEFKAVVYGELGLLNPVERPY